MPYGDGTGPQGDPNWICRRGLGFRGRRNIIAPTVVLDKEQQKKVLKAELEQIEIEKKEIEKKLKEIK